MLYGIFIRGSLNAKKNEKYSDNVVGSSDFGC